MTKMNHDERWQAEKDAHELIVKLCAAKNIGLRLRQEGFSGHMQWPEIWALEKPVPLSAEDRKAIAAHRVLSIETKIGDDGRVYAEKFIRENGFVRYEEDTDPDAKFIF